MIMLSAIFLKVILTCFWCLQSCCCNIRISCLDVCLEVAVLETHWKIPSPVPSVFFVLNINKNQKGISREQQNQTWLFSLHGSLF